METGSSGRDGHRRMQTESAVEGSCVWTRRKATIAKIDPERELTRLFPSRTALILSLLHSPSPPEFRDLVVAVAAQGKQPSIESLSLLPMESSVHALYIWCYKVEKCKEEDCDPQHCFDYHSEEDCRRRPGITPNGLWTYTPTLCRRGTGCAEDTCTLAHTCFEIDFHPTRYKTQPCPFKTNKLGICRVGVHCPNYHKDEKPRVKAPSVLTQQFLQGNRDRREMQSTEVGQQSVDVGGLSLSELQKTRLNPITHQLIEDLKSAQQERMRYSLELQEKQSRLEVVQTRVQCIFCQSRPRTRLLTCGHSVCDFCVPPRPCTCSICQQSVTVLALKGK